MADVDYGERAVLALQAAIEADDPDRLYQDTEALYGIARQGLWAGQIEGLLQQLPHRHRIALRRAGRATAAAVLAPNTGSNQGDVTLGSLPILAKRGDAWLMLSGSTYVQVASDILPVEVAREHPLVRQTVPTADGGERAAKPAEIFELAGGVRADAVVYRMGATEPGWNVLTRTLTIPCAQYRHGPAGESARVGGWLRALCRDRLDQVLDWVALHPRLHLPIAALYLEGPPGCGKGLLADAICSLWGGERSSYNEVVLKGWSAGLRRTPIVHLDERAARDREERGSAAFRSFVAESSRELTEKYQVAGTIVGCPRFVVTSQGPDALRISGEDLTLLDEQAIGERILHVLVSTDARRVLEMLGGRAETEGWSGHGGELTAHLRWVIETRRVEPGLRFLVSGDSAAWLRGHASREGLPQQILVAVARSILGVMPPHAPDVARCHAGSAWVSCELLHSQWAELTGQQRAPSLAALGRGLGRLGERVRTRPLVGPRIRAYQIPAELLLEVADLVGLDDELLRSRLGVHELGD